MFILGEKLFFTFSHVINPKSLNLTSQLAVGRIRTSKHFCFCPYGRQTDWTRHGSRPVWIHRSRCGSYKWHIPTKQNMVSMGEPLTPAGSWSPSSLLMNLERGQWLLFFPDHLRPCHLCTSAMKAYFLVTILGSKWMASLGPWSEGFSSMMLVHLVHFLTV